MVIRRRLDLIGPAMAFITTGVDKGIPALSNRQVLKVIADQLKETALRENLSIVGYVLMPNHVHLLIGFPRVERMSAIVRDFKRKSAWRVRGVISPQEMRQFLKNGSFKFWQRRFDDVIIFSEEQFRVKLNYVHQNPVRAGLVVRQEDYAYSSAGDWMGEGPGPISVDLDWKWTGGTGT